ncbi:ABC-2 transporter permease [Pseudoflavonifractor sp. SW1122]|uniref:ABC-2 transporter permease n=1 Tax=Pseudoflavonifractor sp. SW1122 TaxID=2530044 RepID=UPI001438DA02|nr:ABC-2 transporter permease [Pseudoflavonifractor sp. SW1122]NJE75048.1 ABC-2 transporter permease [Pseudoflavonifractor sp. SW1122]
MKGLLLKDFYMAKRYFGWFMLVIAGMLIMSCLVEDMQIFLIYPMIVSNIIPVSLIAYDEHDKWSQYSGTLPYTRAQVVTGKYLVSVCLGVAFFLLSMAVASVRMQMYGQFIMEAWMRIGVIVLILGCLAPILMLPVVFKFGAEKGRVIYLVILGVICGVLMGLDVKGISLSTMHNLWPIVAVLGVMVALYILSWRLSIRFYQKRDL